MHDLLGGFNAIDPWQYLQDVLGRLGEMRDALAEVFCMFVDALMWYIPAAATFVFRPGISTKAFEVSAADGWTSTEVNVTPGPEPGMSLN